MHFDLDARTVALSAGELAAFSLGPRASAGGAGGLWRAQLGQHWHNELRRRAGHDAGVRFEVAIDGKHEWRGWTFQLGGRIDQLVERDGAVTLREIKTVTRPLPASETELHAEYPEYFVQLCAYLVLHTSPGAATPPRGELVFVEAGSGFIQTVAAPDEPAAVLHAQLDELVAFLDQRRRARERRRALPVRAAFAALRPGQENVQRDLSAALGLASTNYDLAAGARATVAFFEAPTGFGKTGCLLEFALGALRDGLCDRVLYLTGKSTGQLQVVRQLEAMLSPAPGDPPAAARLPWWQVRSKKEHCVNRVYHCLPDACPFLAGAEERWPRSGLSRFFLTEGEPRDLESLRSAGRLTKICPYEITRAALPFNDVWVGDYNYVFSPANRGLFFEQPGFDAASTLLIVDEAHNLPTRVADAYSHAVRAADAWATLDALRTARAPATFLLHWENWARTLDDLRPADELAPADEAALRAAAHRLGELVPATALDFVALGPEVAELLWQLPALDEFLEEAKLPKLLWVPARGELRVTCLDAASAVGETLRRFRHAILTSATLSPADALSAACGLDRPPADAPTHAAPADLDAALGKVPRKARKALKGITTGAALLHVEEARTADTPSLVQADAPWRRGAYRTAIDVRVDTRYEQRARHHDTTAESVGHLAAAARAARSGETTGDNAAGVAVFFPSYAYAEAIAERCAAHGKVRVAVPPRGGDLAAQAAFIEASLATHDALFLVLGTGFTEGIDLLGGRVTHAMVVGPALPEVNAVQRAKLALAQQNAPQRDAAFRQVYQIPGMQKVNQALGRLVRAPGHRATVLLHCRRFAERSYRDLLDAELRHAPVVDTDEYLHAWLAGRELH